MQANTHTTHILRSGFPAPVFRRYIRYRANTVRPYIFYKNAVLIRCSRNARSPIFPCAWGARICLCCTQPNFLVPGVRAREIFSFSYCVEARASYAGQIPAYFVIAIRLEIFRANRVRPYNFHINTVFIRSSRIAHNPTFSCAWAARISICIDCGLH